MEFTSTKFRIITDQWSELQRHAKQIRYAVFVDEQGISENIEIDDKDIECVHVVIMHADGFPVATARMDASGKIGRMAVLAEWRNKNLGRALLNTLLQLAKDRDLQQVHCHAQQQVSEFYEKAGFNPIDTPFNEAGIVHLKMVKNLI
ncbi:MAG: GNAT family N-acetyltransferase [Gammaproteobacteria bacterium]